MEPSDRTPAEAALHRSQQRYRSLVENSLNGVVQLRVIYEDGEPADFEFVETNRAFDMQLGLGDVIGKRVSAVVPSFRTADPTLFGAYCRVAVSGIPERFEMHSAAMQQWFAFAVYRASPDHIVVVLDDITARKRAEQATLATNAELEQRVAERTHALAVLTEQLERRVGERTAELAASEERLQQLNAELERRVRERTSELESFSYSVSHDLRAPLRAVNGYAHLILEDHGDVIPDDGKQLLHAIQLAGIRMGDLIDDLLRFSQLGRQSLRRATVDTGALVRDVLEELMRDRGDRAIELRIGALAPCNADEALLRQVWMNLASNAFKYSRGRSPAIVEVGCTDDGTYYIQDNGVGFDTRYADRLFGVFQRLHTTSEFEGLGIGLAIVDRIVRRHGGRVWAESDLGRGSTFYVTLGDAAS